MFEVGTMQFYDVKKYITTLLRDYSLETNYIQSLIINREAGEIIRLVASVRPSGRPSVHLKGRSKWLRI